MSSPAVIVAGALHVETWAGYDLRNHLSQFGTRSPLLRSAPQLFAISLPVQLQAQPRRVAGWARPSGEISTLWSAVVHCRRQVLGTLGRRPDASALLALLAIGALLRLAFLFRAPAFYVGGDSQTYLLPAYLLARDGDWDLGYRRPPGYPMFLAGVITFFGEDTRAISLAQHLLGLATIAAAYWLGRAAAGRTVGTIAGLGVALSGPQIVYEHYVMSESLFTLVVVLCAGAALANRSARNWGLAVGVGALLGAGWLIRPAALILAPALPLAMLGAVSFGRAALLMACSTLGFILVVSPWVVFSLSHYGVASPIGLGNNLIWRTTRYELNRLTRNEPPVIGPRDEWPSRDGDTFAAEHRYAFGRATRKDLPDDIADGLARRFGMSEIQADRLLVDVALEAIRNRPLLYAQTTAVQALDVFLGTEQYLGGQGKEGGVTRYADPQSKYASWWNERIRHVPQAPLATEAAEFSTARQLIGLFQPHRVTPVLLMLCVLAVAGGLVSSAQRPGLFLGAVVVAGILGAAAISGSAPRFRYPLDPLIWVLACLGLQAAWLTMRAAWRRLASVRHRHAPLGDHAAA